MLNHFIAISFTIFKSVMKKGKGQAKEHKQRTLGHRQGGGLTVGVGGDGVGGSNVEKAGQLWLNNNT